MRNRWYPAANRDLKVEWDFEDRLVRVTKGDGSVVDNTYDVDGVLVRTSVSPTGGSARVSDLLVDTSGGLSHVVAEIDGSGAVTALYVRAGDMLLEEIRGGVAKMYEADGLGSTRSLLDTTGAQTDTWSYEAFGTTLSSMGTSASPYRFAGERFVSDVGMYQNRARWLDTRTGRFASVDPFGGQRWRPATFHPYLYAEATPAYAVDPTGSYSVVQFTINAAVTITISSVVGAAGSAAYSFAKGEAVTLESVAEGAQAGAVVGGLIVLSPGIAAALGVGFVGAAMPDLFSVLASGQSSGWQKAAAAGLIIASVYGAAAGARYASRVKANPNMLSGHGGLLETDSSPVFRVPEGSPITVYTEHGGLISNSLGNAVESGATNLGFDAFPELVGARTYLPGSYMPNYTLFPNVNPVLPLEGSPTTVRVATPLSRLVRPGMGNVHFAACLEVVHPR